MISGRFQHLVAHAEVGFVAGLARVPVPFVQPQAAGTDRVVGSLVRAGDETVEGDGHVTGDQAHGSSDGWDLPKSSARETRDEAIGAFRTGYRMAVWWALGVVVVVLVGLPLTIGLATRGMASRPPRPLRPGYGKTGQWLHEQYGLDWRDCVRIERAVTRGQQVEDPALEDAAHGLAALIVSGQAPGQRLLRAVGYGSVTLGVGCLAVAIVVVCLGHHAGETPLLIPYALFVTANAWFQQIRGPRRQRRQAARALELNHQAAPARLSFGSEDHQGEGGARDSGDGGDRQRRE